jgi:hypothetical protein
VADRVVTMSDGRLATDARHATRRPLSEIRW